MGRAMKPIKDKSKEIELIEYLKENDKRIYIFYLILRFTGFRASDVLPLKVDDVIGGVYNYQGEKNNK